MHLLSICIALLMQGRAALLAHVRIAASTQAAAQFNSGIPMPETKAETAATPPMAPPNTPLTVFEVVAYLGEVGANV